MKNFFIENKGILIAFAVVFSFSFLFPYTGDDLAWSLTDFSVKSILEVLSDSSLNGRYLGNVFVILMTKCVWIRAIIMAGTLCSIVFIMKRETKVSYPLIWLFILLLSPAVWAQSVVWTSGFTNYVISTLFLLLSLTMLRKSYIMLSFRNGIVCFLLIFLSSFFIENLTVFLFVLTVILNVIYFVKRRKVNFSLLAGFIGSLIGTCLMFMHPAYMKVLDGSDVYRSYGKNLVDLFKIIIENYVFTVHKYAFFENIFLVGTISILIYVYYKNANRKFDNIKNSILKVTFSINMIYFIYALVVRMNDTWRIVIGYHDIINSFLTLIYILNLYIQVFIIFVKKEHFMKIKLPLIFIIGLILPIMVVSPIGPRNFFMIYILELLVVLYMFKLVNIDYSKISKLVNVALTIMLVFYMSIYSQVKLIDNKRNDYIKNVAKNEDIEIVSLPMLPFPKYVYFGESVDPYRLEIYRKFLNIRDNLNINYIDYEKWLNIIEKE